MRPLKEKRLSPQSPQQNHTLNVEDDIAILSKMPNPSESKYQLLQYQCRESKKEREKEGRKERKKERKWLPISDSIKWAEKDFYRIDEDDITDINKFEMKLVSFLKPSDRERERKWH